MLHRRPRVFRIPAVHSKARKSLGFCTAVCLPPFRRIDKHALEEQTSIQTATTSQTRQHGFHESTSAPSIINVLSLRSAIISRSALIVSSLWCISAIALLLISHLWSRGIISSILCGVVVWWRVAIALVWRSVLRIWGSVVLVWRSVVVIATTRGLRVYGLRGVDRWYRAITVRRWRGSRRGIVFVRHCFRSPGRRYREIGRVLYVADE